ncbi:hypothetical protein PR003_g10539 [Phytophthora rubi]|uniref:Uncharacterized protein n=1 Tax=Phytophthora rubi TaxID=129364 RepID=A0A6A4FQS9_9STRA|nr:hypothetical protein PR002_g10251 [Phytophthora rubi]KAE9340329.1 hypothetical protein PR003_g10539 [Phytophthora rubi]
MFIGEDSLLFLVLLVLLLYQLQNCLKIIYNEVAIVVINTLDIVFGHQSKNWIFGWSVDARRLRKG